MKKIQLFFTITFILFLTGCGGNLKKWKNATFNQAPLYDTSNQNKIIKKYVRSLSLYDQFETVALFDGLWLSDEIKTLASDLHVKLQGKNKEVRNNFLRRQLRDNSEYVSFYVLSQHQVSLAENATQWYMHLQIGDHSYSPASVKLIEITPEYRIILNKKFTPHKDIYEVKFLRRNNQGKDILEEGQTLQLFFNGLHHYGMMEWNLALHRNFVSSLE